MMMKYTNLNDVRGYHIKEELTSQIVAENLSAFSGLTLRKHLNRGGGFDGWTPSFFLQRLPITTEDY